MAHKIDEIINSLIHRPNSPFLLDKINRERLNQVINDLGENEVVLAQMVATLHSLIDNKMPVTPFLLSTHLIRSKCGIDELSSFLDCFNQFKKNLNDKF